MIHNRLRYKAKLSGEEGEIYVLQWLVNTEKILKDAPSVRRNKLVSE